MIVKSRPGCSGRLEHHCPCSSDFPGTLAGRCVRSEVCGAWAGICMVLALPLCLYTNSPLQSASSLPKYSQWLGQAESTSPGRNSVLQSAGSWSQEAEWGDQHGAWVLTGSYLVGCTLAAVPEFWNSTGFHPSSYHSRLSTSVKINEKLFLLLINVKHCTVFS